MGIYRQIQTNFWKDGFLVDITPEEKYFYLYLLSNDNTRQCGIYELPKKIIEFDTGYSRERVEKLLKRFVKYGKILYSEETKEIFVLNWNKYNFIKSKNTIVCINKELKQVKNKEFIERYFEVCSSLDLPVDEIFKGIDICFNKEHSMDLEEPYKELCEEEQEQIKEAAEEEQQEQQEQQEQVEKNKQEQDNEKENNLGTDVEVFNSNISTNTTLPNGYEKAVDCFGHIDCPVEGMDTEDEVNDEAGITNYTSTILARWKKERMRKERRDYSASA